MSAGKATAIYIGANDLTRYFNSLSLPTEVGEIETTTFGPGNDKEYMPDQTEASVSVSGFYVNTVGEPIDDILAAAVGGAAKPATVGLAGGAVGNPAKLLSSREGKYEVKSSIGDAVRTSIELRANGALDTGIFLHPLQAETVVGGGTSVDNGAATTNGWAATLHITATSGSSTVKVQHSADGTVWADLATFAASSVPASQYLTGSGTVNRYLRAHHTPSGGTPSVTYVLAAVRR